MQIVVKTPAGEAIALEVESADTTEYVKAKALHAIASSSSSSPSPSPGGGGVSPPADHHQRYCLVSAAGEQLGRRTTLTDNGIVEQEDGATPTLDLVVDPEPPMQIVVKMLNREEFTVDDVYGSDTIFSVKVKIHRQHGIPASVQRYVGNRQRLVSGRTLASYGVEDKSAVFCVLAMGSIKPWMQQWMRIFFAVKPPPAAEAASSGANDYDWKGWKGFYLEVETMDNAGVVKERIELQMNIAASQQRLLLHDGKQMDDGVALTEYGLRHKSGIHLLIRPL